MRVSNVTKYSESIVERFYEKVQEFRPGDVGFIHIAEHEIEVLVERSLLKEVKTSFLNRLVFGRKYTTYLNANITIYEKDSIIKKW